MGSSSESAEFEYDVCVVGGCGHVGLPLAITFAHARACEVASTTSNDAPSRWSGRAACPSSRRGASRSSREVIGRTLHRRQRPDARLEVTLIVVVVIGTPVDEHLNPTFHTMRRFFAGLLPHLVDGQCLILRSTVYPGTTEKIRDARRRVGQATSTSPSAPSASPRGKAMEELVELPQIVSGLRRARPSTMAERALRPDRPVDHPALAARGRADQDLRQRLAVHPVRHRQPVLHDRDRLRPRLLPDLRRADPRLSADGRAAQERVRRRPLPVQGHDAARGGDQQQLRARPRGDADQRGAAQLPRPARSRRATRSPR